MKYVVCLLLGSLFIFTACAPKTYHSGFSPNGTKHAMDEVPPRPKGEPGACYALVQVPRSYIPIRQVYKEYTGNDSKAMGIVKTEVEIKPRIESWVKKPDKNCRSADPADCLVWCKVVEERETISFLEVRDTVAIKDFQEKVVLVNQLKNDTYKDWTRVVCELAGKPKLVKELRSALYDKGYMPSQNCKNSVSCLMKTVKQFQLDHELPAGALSYETLDYLGVSYK